MDTVPRMGLISLFQTKDLVAYNNVHEAQNIPEKKKKKIVGAKPRSNLNLNRKAKCASEILNKNYPKRT